MLQLFGYISGFLVFLCYFPYIKDTLQKKTQPERASWLIWTVLGSIAFFSQFAKGATDSLWLTGVETVGVLIIFLLSIKFGVGGLTKKDLIALLIALLGLIIWYFTKEAAIALLIVIGIDAVGGFLTIQKAYLDPGSETMATWLLAGISGIFAMLSVGSWDLILLIYPFYIFLQNFAVVAAMLIGNQKKS